MAIQEKLQKVKGGKIENTCFTQFILLRLKQIWLIHPLDRNSQYLKIYKYQDSSFFPDKINRTGVPIKQNDFRMLFIKYRLYEKWIASGKFKKHLKVGGLFLI